MIDRLSSAVTSPNDDSEGRVRGTGTSQLFWGLGSAEGGSAIKGGDDVPENPGNAPGGSGPVELRSIGNGRRAGLAPMCDCGLGLRLSVLGLATPVAPLPACAPKRAVEWAVAGEMTLISSSKLRRGVPCWCDTSCEEVEARGGDRERADTAEARTEGTVLSVAS